MTDNTLRTAIARAIRGADPAPIGDGIQFEAVVFPLEAGDAVLKVLAAPGDAAITRMARELYLEDMNESYDDWPEWESPENDTRPAYEERARAALAALVGGESDE